jgi:hypothetical protein
VGTALAKVFTSYPRKFTKSVSMLQFKTYA